MSWYSRNQHVRLDCLTSLDAAAMPSVSSWLTGLMESVDSVREVKVLSVRRLARGQVRVDVRLRLEGENRLTVQASRLSTCLGDLVGTARYLTLGGIPLPLIRLYRTRVLNPKRTRS